MENTVLEGVLKQLSTLRSSQFVKSVLLHEYFRSDEVKQKLYSGWF